MQIFLVRNKLNINYNGLTFSKENENPQPRKGKKSGQRTFFDSEAKKKFWQLFTSIILYSKFFTAIKQNI